MTADKVRKVIEEYYRKLESMGITESKDYPHDDYMKDYFAMPALYHCRSMLDKMEEFIKAGRMDKVMRWLGFIQGVLWVNRVYTLEELKNHNKKDPS